MEGQAMSRTVRNVATGRRKLEGRTFTATPVKSYEEHLDADLEWAMSEGSRFFEGRGAVQEALKRITSRLNELGIPYAVVGGMALFAHGFRRFTEDVDLLVTREGLNEIHRNLQGHGYRPAFEGSKNLRDTEHGVKIEFLVAGDYPGDGKPKPVVFPGPSGHTIQKNGIQYINLEALIELKLASGLSNPERMKDLVDVIELIKTINLPTDLSKKLNAYVRAKYLELWNAAHPGRRRYIRLLDQQLAGIEAESLEELVDRVRPASETLKAMLADGVKLERTRNRTTTRPYFATTDPEVAAKYDMHDESEFLFNEGTETFQG
jgi:nucleotidyltransferase AbiEii toxin of type IV toxin-antitoxin system